MKFLRLPCHVICREIWVRTKLGSPIKRFHLSCLTCPPRRYHYFNERSGFVKVQHGTILATTASGRLVPVPNPGVFAYFIMVKLNCLFPKLKDLIVKCFMILLEKISSWNVEASEFKRYVFFNLADECGMVLPLSFKAYFILVPYCKRLQSLLIKFVASFAERIAEM